jgi:hypothetical protein
MNAPRGPELESALRRSLAQLAPAVRPPMLDRTLAAVAETPQRRGAVSRMIAWRSAWTWGAASVVVVAGIVAGVIIGNSTPAFVGDGSGSSLASPTSSATATLGSTGTPEPSTAPTQPVPPGTWEGMDLPDPAPGVFATTRASDVVAFDGGYVAIGGYEAGCISDIHEPPAGCDAALAALPATASAVVWRSDDAREWDSLPYQASFEGATMDHGATDGVRIVATGFVLDPNARRPVAWVSDDARTWERVGPGGSLPEQLVSTEVGFVGVRPTDDGPQFVASDDGRSWRPLSTPGEHGPGEVMGMSVGIDGTTVVAFGATYEYSDDGTDLLRIIGTSWLSQDGLTWQRAPANDGHEGAWMSAAAESDTGWVAVGLDQTPDVEPADEMAVWTSPDGLTWTRVPTPSIARAFDGYADAVAWTGEHLVATGSVTGEGGSVVAFWLSRDGMNWDIVEGQQPLANGSPDRLIALDGWILASGVRFAGPDHMVGVIWLGSP